MKSKVKPDSGSLGTQIDAQFHTLSEAASALNRESDVLTASIREVESKLNKLNLGTQCWITIDKLADIHLGYGSSGKAWGFLVRHKEDEWQLTAAPRYLRIKVVSSFPDLLEHIAHATKTMVDRTQEATELARSFSAAIGKE